MALLVFEGFDHQDGNMNGGTGNFSYGFAAGDDGDQGWSTTPANNGSKVAGLLGGSAYSMGNTNCGPKNNGFGNLATIITGHRCLFGTVGLVNFLTFYDGATVQCGFALNASGKIIFWRGTNATILATGSATIAAGGWKQFECKVTFHGSTGSVEWRLDQTVDGSASSLNTIMTANAYANAAWWTGFGDTSVDDIYICDTTGIVANNYLGNVRVETLFANTNNSVTWTPLTSTNVSQVPETTLNRDTSYNVSSASGQVDTFAPAALSSTPSTIYGVKVIAAIRKDDTTLQTVRTKLISGVTTQNGASRTDVNTGYKYFSDTYLVDPNTGVAWTGANVNAAKIGYEHV